jgi:hypothetical protein
MRVIWTQAARSRLKIVAAERASVSARKSHRPDPFSLIGPGHSRTLLGSFETQPLVLMRSTSSFAHQYRASKARLPALVQADGLSVPTVLWSVLASCAAEGPRRTISDGWTGGPVTHRRPKAVRACRRRRVADRCTPSLSSDRGAARTPGPLVCFRWS